MPQIQIRDLFDNPIPKVNIRLALGNGSSDSAYDDKFSDLAGNLAWPNPLPSSTGYNLFVNDTNILPEYKSTSLHVNDLNSDIKITLERESLSRISIDGLYFNKRIEGETAFLDYYRYLLGHDLTPLLKQSIKWNSNCRRNFFMTKNTAQAAGLPPFNPLDFGNDFYDKLPSFLDLYASCGIYLYCSIFPDNGLFPLWSGNLSLQKNHWNKIGEIAKSHTAVFALELTNEIDAHSFNWVDNTQFSKISGVLCCSGSVGDSAGQIVPNQWDFLDYHQPRGYPTVVLDANCANHPNRINNGTPIFLGEPKGFGNKGQNPNREDNPRIAKEINGASKGCAAGTIYHTTHGSFSQTYDQIELDCGDVWFGV